MKKILALTLSLVLSAVLFTTAIPTIAHATEPSVWIMNSADKVYDGSSLPDSPVTSITLYAAKGEYEAAQICVKNNNGSAITVSSITPGNLTNGGDTIASSNITVRREYIHTGVAPMGGDSPDNETPPAGSTGYPDALVPINVTVYSFNAASIAASKTGIYWYSVYVPPDQSPGTYTGTVTISTSAGNTSVNVSVTVYDVTMPDTDQSTIKADDWAFTMGWISMYDVINYYYGYANFSANWWTVVSNYAADLEKHRNNVILMDILGFLKDDVVIDASQNITFDWTKFDQYVQLFIDAGAGQYMKVYGTLDWVTDPYAPILALQNIGGTVQFDHLAVDSAAANKYLDQFFGQLKTHLEYKTQNDGWPAWSDFLYMTAGDEAWQQYQIDADIYLYDKYHEYFPGGKTMEAGSVTTQWGSSVTGYCPLISQYYTSNWYYQEQSALGKELWSYVCCYPEGSHMNRYISQHLAKSRLLYWDFWKNGVVGFLHAGWDRWWEAAATAEGTFTSYINGDQHIVYPDISGMSIYDSIRYEAQLDGLEDYELLNILAQTKPVAARRIADGLIINGTDYTRSGADITASHKAILDAIVSTGPDAIPYSAFLNNEYAMTDTSAIFTHVLLDCSVGSDFTMNFDAKIDSVDGGAGNYAWAGCIVRGLDDTIQTGYLVGVRNNGYAFIWRTNDYVTSEVAVPGYTPGQYVNIKIVASGSNIKVYAGNGTDASTSPILDYTDTQSVFATGKVSLATGWSNSTFKNVVVSQGTNYALGATVTSSSSYEGDNWSVTRATDGQRSSVEASPGWSSSSNLYEDHSEWVQVDLGQSRRISRVDLYPRNGNTFVGVGFPINFTIQVSNDNTNWSTVVPKTGYPQPINEVQAFTFPACTARYIRINASSLRYYLGEGTYRMQLSEIEIYDETPSPEAPSMDYEFGSDVQGWSAQNNVSGFGFGVGGYIDGIVTGIDPYLHSPDYLGVDITAARTLKIRIKNSTSSTIGQIYFITNEDAAWNEAKNMNFTIVANDQGYTEYTIDMSTVSGWTGTLRRLRLDPNAGVSSGSFSVDYIRLYSPAVDPAARSAAEASSALPAWPKGNSIDGDADTAWSSAYHSGEANIEWLYLDMGANGSVKGVRLLPRTDSGTGRCFPEDFKFMYSTDASSWYDVPGQSYVGYADPGAAEQTFLFGTPVTARYVLLYATKLRDDGLGGYYLQIAEINADR